MYYIYVIAIPLMIIGLNYLIMRRKPKSISGYIDLLLRSIPHEFGYVFFLYYLDMEHNVDTGWSVITLFTFLIPISVLVIAFKLFYYIKRRNTVKEN